MMLVLPAKRSHHPPHPGSINAGWISQELQQGHATAPSFPPTPSQQRSNAPLQCQWGRQEVAELALQQAAAQGRGGADQCAAPSYRNPHRKSMDVFAMRQFTTLPNPFATERPSQGASAGCEPPPVANLKLRPRGLPTAHSCKKKEICLKICF
jgi:hypothetical protein